MTTRDNASITSSSTTIDSPTTRDQPTRRDHPTTNDAEVTRRIKRISISAATLMCLTLFACDEGTEVSVDSGTLSDIEIADANTSDLGVNNDAAAEDAADASVVCMLAVPPTSRELATAFLSLWTIEDPSERRCVLESVFGEDATYRSSVGYFEGRDAVLAHVAAAGFGARSLTSGTPVHHNGLRFTWEESGASTGIVLGLLDDSGRFASLTDHSGTRATSLDDLGPYAQYLAAWNESDPAARDVMIAESWAEGAPYADPTAAGAGRGALGSIIQDYMNRFNERRIVLRDLGHVFENAYWVSWAIRNEADDVDLIAGMDFCQLTDDGSQIASLFSFFGEVTEPGVGGNVGACLSCIDRQILGANPADLCTGGTPTSVEINTGLNVCVCTNACAETCGDNLCIGMAPSASCGACIADPGGILEACPAESAACWGDG